jgi:hypothetical protein
MKRPQCAEYRAPFKSDALLPFAGCRGIRVV